MKLYLQSLVLFVSWNVSVVLLRSLGAKAFIMPDETRILLRQVSWQVCLACVKGG